MKLYNTLTKKIEDFQPRQSNKVNMFVCGPTVYDFSHIGHAKTYTQMDVLARVLGASGYAVFYLQNMTDIDDKIIARAKYKGESWETLRTRFGKEYLADMKSLNNTSVTKYARATDHIDDIIHQIQTLMDKGYAYQIDDGIYFEISKFKDYGKLSGRTEVKENDAESRIDQSDSKRGWNDFCLWKFSKPDEPTWDAPFGRGRPGWHIEDTAITEHFFGSQYDLHGGAVDLIFPHHEAEITQMESASGKVPFVKYWVHTNFLNINNEKMSKSLNNFFTIREVIEKGYDPMVIRLFMLQSHYRSAINFSWDNLAAAKTRLKNYRAFADLRWSMVETKTTSKLKQNRLKESQQKILETLQDDLQLPKALSILDELEAQTLLNNAEDVNEFKRFLEFLDEVLGLNLLKSNDLSSVQYRLIDKREKARQVKDFAKSDELRDKLNDQGIGLRDTDQGAIWFRL